MSAAGNGPQILCVGDVMVDVVARLAGPLQTGSDAAAETALHGGGSAANTACWLDHAGIDVSLVGRVGADVLGAWSVDRLGERVARSVTVDATAATGTCVVLVAPDGERTMVPDPGANATLRPDHLPPAMFAAGRHLHVSGYAIFGAAQIAALRAISMARSAGMTISVGAASAAPLRRLGADPFLGLIGSPVLLFANRAEAHVLTKSSDIGAAATTLSERIGEAVITDGPDDAVWASADGLVSVAAEPTRAIDTTGAGDAFAAGLLGTHLQGAEPADALRSGHALAALACRTVGARPPRTAG